MTGEPENGIPASARTRRSRPFYSSWADVYDLLIDDPVEPWVDIVHTEVTAQGPAAASILDAGCGMGRHAAALVALGHHLTLLDASPDLLAIAARRCPDARVRQEDLASMLDVMPDPRNYSAGTRAALAWLSQGKCYFPDCNRSIIFFEDGEAYIDYQIAHVRDAKVGNRYDIAMTDDDRRRFNNLVLLCKPHHELVDKRHPERYPTIVLQQWKSSREAVAPLAELSGSTEQEVEHLLSTMHLEVGASIVAQGGIGGSAPGAGGGGGGAVGPGARGGDGGAGGETVHVMITDLEGLASIEVEVGEGGEGGRAGGDTVLTGVMTDGRKVELARARGGQGGDRSEIEVRGTGFLADGAFLRGGLLTVVAGFLDHWRGTEPSVLVSACFVLIVERHRRSDRGVAHIQVSLLDSSEDLILTETLTFDFLDAAISRAFGCLPLCVDLVPGTYSMVARQGDNEISALSINIEGPAPKAPQET